MKLVFAIINSDDSGSVTRSLTKNGFSSTRLATTGGFLMSKNVTLMVGVDEEKVSEVIDIIKQHCHSRKQLISTASGVSRDFPTGMPVEVNVGGATIFVVDVEQFQRV